MGRISKLDSEIDLKKAIEQYKSYAGVLKHFGLKPLGSNYRTIKNKIKKYNIDISHFTGQGHNKGKIIGPKRTITEYLNNNYFIKSYNLKRRLFIEGYKQKKCENCGLSEWMGVGIPLELDHIDGDNQNNNINNLKILCPNCHSLTPTFRRNKPL